MEVRIVAALGIIAVCTVGAAVALAILTPRRRRRQLRLRGIKRHELQHSVSNRQL